MDDRPPVKGVHCPKNGKQTATMTRRALGEGGGSARTRALMAPTARG